MIPNPGKVYTMKQIFEELIMKGDPYLGVDYLGERTGIVYANPEWPYKKYRNKNVTYSQVQEETVEALFKTKWVYIRLTAGYDYIFQALNNTEVLEHLQGVATRTKPYVHPKGFPTLDREYINLWTI
jgi:hypothetical protein